MCNVKYPSSETEDTKCYPINKFHAHIYMPMRFETKIPAKIYLQLYFQQEKNIISSTVKQQRKKR